MSIFFSDYGELNESINIPKRNFEFKTRLDLRGINKDLLNYKPLYGEYGFTFKKSEKFPLEEHLNKNEEYKILPNDIDCMLYTSCRYYPNDYLQIEYTFGCGALAGYTCGEDPLSWGNLILLLDENGNPIFRKFNTHILGISPNEKFIYEQEKDCLIINEIEDDLWKTKRVIKIDHVKSFLTYKFFIYSVKLKNGIYTYLAHNYYEDYFAKIEVPQNEIIKISYSENGIEAFRNNAIELIKFEDNIVQI